MPKLNDQYSFCEPVWVATAAPWCVRRLTDKGRKVSGGVDTPSLCGRVDPTKGGGWDLSAACQVSLEHSHMCARCRTKLEALLKRPDPASPA
jgi:hypothetical protein